MGLGRVGVGVFAFAFGALGCGGDEPPAAATGEGGASTTSTSTSSTDAIGDIPCTSQSGCVRGRIQVGLACTAPDDGMGATAWDASVDVTPSEANAGCWYVPAWDGSLGYVALSLGAIDEDGLAIGDVPFESGGIYHLGGLLGNGAGYMFHINATGGRTGAGGATHATTESTCSTGCELDVLPHGRELVADGWTTLRFVVTCSEPLGIPEYSCGKCTMTPTSFQVDAACYAYSKPQ